jgi:uncharacterized membrane protein (DUF4010 family)
MWSALLGAGVVAVVYGAVFTLHGSADGIPPRPSRHARAFSLKSAVLFAAFVGGMLLVAAAIQHWAGQRGVIVAAGLAGFADTHAAAISVASLVRGGTIATGDAVIPILAGLTTNTVSKIVFAYVNGGAPFALRVVPGLVLVIAGAWTGAVLGGVSGGDAALRIYRALPIPSPQRTLGSSSGHRAGRRRSGLQLALG